MNCRIYFAVKLLAVLTFSASTTSVAAQMTKSSPSSSVISQTSPTSTKPVVVTELVEQLRTADVEKRRQIIQQLSDSRQNNSQQNIVPELLQALSDPDTLVKSGVAEVLGNLTDASVPAIPALIEMMSSTQRAIVPSGGLPGGLPSLPSLRLPSRIPIFSPSSSTEERRSPPNPPENPESLLRITAIAALGKIGLPARIAATQPLTQALQDRDPWVKLNATWALAEIGASTPLLAYWLEAIQHPNPALRRNAAQLFRDNRSLLPKVFGSEADASTTFVLLAVLKDEDEYVRDTASRALELLGTKALPGLVQALKAPEPIVRLEAAQRLGDMGGSAQSAVPNLLELLQDNGRYVPPPRKPGELFQIPLSAAIPYFRENPPAPDNPEKLVRVNAAIALGRLGDRKTIPALKNALKDNNPWMQLATAWTLFRLGQNQGLPVIGRLIQHPNVSIQYQALTQLRRYGSQSASYLLPYYKARLDSKSDDERNNAIIGIGDMGVAALDLVPKLRTILIGNRKHSPAYAATVLGQIARDTATAWQNGNLSSQQRQQAIAEFTKVLQIIQAPNARFNREPGNRVSNALNILRNGR
ncbi:MAG: HEAT repeat domain-containing protein [Scytonematopsis contorta HA4267-MV1]|nr:HEAT repeat domain-containing protein [Scytonematopsis contorta HA4267-MV1]